MAKNNADDLRIGVDELDKDDVEENFQDNLNKDVGVKTEKVLQDVLDDFLDEGPDIRKTCSFYLLEKIDKELDRQVERINKEKSKKGENFKKINKGQLLEKILLKTLNLE